MKQKSCAPTSIMKHSCKTCDYNTDRKSSFDKHLASRKHLCNQNSNFCNNKVADNFICSTCDKIYNSRVTLWRHKKKCQLPDFSLENIAADASNNEITLLTNLVFEIVKNNTELQKQTNELFKQNQEYQKQTQDLQKQVLDVCQKIQPISNMNNTHINSHNKTFNLQFFLNEQCKDAMNIMDFVNTFQLQLSDLERIGEVGYVEGISNIVIDKLNQMDVYKRPIHCSDAKREIMHVKDKDVWEKENAANDKIRLALKHITKKNTDLLRPWVNAHPGVLDSEHRLNDKYQQLFIEAMGGNSGTLTECDTKIIKRISKMVLIDKGMV